MSKPATLEDHRQRHMVFCGLDAFCRTADEWLECAIAAEARGHGSLQQDYERAAELRQEQDAAIRNRTATQETT